METKGAADLTAQQLILKKDNKTFEFSASPSDYKFKAHELKSLTLNQRQRCDLELLLNGGFAPLTEFLNQRDYENVLLQGRLASGALWPMPIMLDVNAAQLSEIKVGEEIALRDVEGILIAILLVESWWEVDKQKEALAVFGTVDETHPGVHYLFNQTKQFYLSGKLLKIAAPVHYDFNHLRHTPIQLREIFLKNGWQKVVAFQTRNPMHRAHKELTLAAAKKTGAVVLLHPVVGLTKPGDIEYYTRVRCYEHVLKTYHPVPAFLSLLPLAMRMAGPKEALWHALIRKNYGCSHFIVGRDHAGPGKDSQGQDFYPPYAAQELTLQHQKEMDIEIVPFPEMVYSEKQAKYFFINEFPQNEVACSLSGTALRKALVENLPIPAWFSYREVIDELRRVHPLKHRQGLTIFLTGLPSSGKSTLAQALAIKLRELCHRQITLLDGDVIRTHLSYGLGFSRNDREMNIQRVGFVAQEITKHGGIAICALVAPFAQTRELVRQMITEVGGFIEIYVATPLATCELRDRKGMYKKAREGVIKQFTGISDPYQAPSNPEISLDTSDQDPHALINLIIDKIKTLGYIQ